MRLFTGHRAPVRTLACTADGQLLASGSEDGTVRIWDVATTQTRAILRGLGSYSRTLAFTRDGTILAGAGYHGGRIHLWRATDGEEAGSIDSDLATIYQLAFGDTFLAAVGVDHHYPEPFHLYS